MEEGRAIPKRRDIAPDKVTEKPRFMVLGRDVVGWLSRNTVSLSAPLTSRKGALRASRVHPSNTQRLRVPHWIGIAAGTFRCVLRIAYYLGTVLSAVLTTDSKGGESCTLTAEASSAAFRYGLPSPTFFKVVVLRRGYRPPCIFS